MFPLPDHHIVVSLICRRVIWISQEDQSRGFAVGYRAIMVHAVSRDPEAYDKPCIFVQLDSDFDESIEEDEEVQEDAPEVVSELRLAPTDPDQRKPSSCVPRGQGCFAPCLSLCCHKRLGSVSLSASPCVPQSIQCFRP